MFMNRKDVSPLIRANTWHRYAATSFPVVRRQRSHLVYVCLELMLRGRLHLT
jgi:hypothetical protein